MINSFINRQFFNITQTELDPSKILAQNICEICFDTTKEFSEFKRQLIHNQQTLSEAIKCESVKVEAIEVSYSEAWPEKIEFVDEFSLQTPSNIEVEENVADLVTEGIVIQEEHLDSSTEEVFTREVVVEGNKEVRHRRKEKKKLCSGANY